jgi:flagellar basal-body rod modification protein FlgD
MVCLATLCLKLIGFKKGSESMSLVAPVEDGKFVQSASQSSLSKSREAGNDMDKDAFLQLLVAQMKYQDPLQPTSNTEYISQYAQFSQVEQMQSMSASMDLQRASELVGKEVYVKTTTTGGETKFVQGKVDYVVYENGKAFLAIDESLYSLDDLDTVTDPAYMEAYNLATELVEKINKLPGINSVDLSDADKITELEEQYNNMNAYESHLWLQRKWML